MYQCNLCCYAPELCETMRNYAKLRETMRNYAKLRETMQNYAKLCETNVTKEKLWVKSMKLPLSPPHHPGSPPSQVIRNQGYPCPTQAVSWYQLALYDTTKKCDLLWVSVLTKYRYFYTILEKGILPYWRQGIYEKLLSGIRDSLPNIFRFQNRSVNCWTCPRVTGPKNTVTWVWNMKNL